MITGIHHISLKCGTKEEFEKVRHFYLDILGLTIKRQWAEGVMFDTGNGYLEIFTNGEGIKAQGAIRHMAFACDDIDGIARKLQEEGYEPFNGPKDIVIKSDLEYPARIVFCFGPLGEEIEFFDENRRQI